MRGILLVVLGAALIWLGLGRGGSSSAAGPSEGATNERAALDGPPPVNPEVAGRADGEGAGPAPDTASNAGEAPAAVSETPARLVEVEEADSSSPARKPTGAVEPDLGLAEGGRPQSAATPSGAGPVPAPEELGRLLVASWSSAQPAELERYIQTGDGARLPVGRRQLVASFWQACMGQTERAEAQLTRLEGDDGVTEEHLALLRAALAEPGARAIPATANARDPLARAMRMVLAADEGHAAAARQDHARAAAAYSELIHNELGAPWAPQHDALLKWGGALVQAQRQHRLSPLGRWASRDYVVVPNDSLIRIRKKMVDGHAGLLLCVGLMEEVNDIVDGRITPGQSLRFPIDVPNALVDLDARVVVFRLGTEAVCLWPVGIGREGHDTPVGTYEVGEKLENPPHMPEGGPALPFGHPDNPLGTRWIAWNKAGKNTSFGFHGTSDPDGVGGRVSQGCVRMRNEDVEELFELLPRDARVIVQP